MSKLRRQKAKERFLKDVEIVDKEVILNELKSNAENDDLYTYFVKKNAFNTGSLKESDLNEFLLKTYSDWYFLHRTSKNISAGEIRILSDVEYSPAILSGKALVNLIKSGEYKNILPINIQYINKLEDQYFIAIKVDEVYNREFKDARYEVRLYINLPCDKLLDFAKEFLDKAYLEEFPAVLKVLNNDSRCDDIIIYTDYEYVEKVIEVIEEIKKENSRMFSSVGAVNPLLGNINDYIGFGELLEGDTTYFASRTKALSSMQKMAGAELLTKGLVAEEKKIIFRTDDTSYTATEYLQFLIEKNIVKLVEKKIEELENSGEHNTEELDRLYDMRDNVSTNVDIASEVNKLKRSLTRNVDYTLELDGVGSDNYDYLAKLYRLFTSADTRNLKTHSLYQKKDIINKQIFKTTETFEGVDTREFLDTYFKAKLSMAVKEILDKDLESTKRSRQSAVLINIRKKSCAKLKSILTSIVDDGDEGREYIGRCISDYVRILSTDALENVEITIDGRTITLDTNVNEDIINMLPALKEEVEKLSVSGEFIDNILAEYGINKNNLCLHSCTKNCCKERTKKEEKESRSYYYNPDGYLSK